MEHMPFFHNQEVVGQRQKLQNVMPSFLSALFEIKGERRRKEERKKEGWGPEKRLGGSEHWLLCQKTHI